MATNGYAGLPRSVRRRLLRRALVRPIACAAVSFVLYFTLPLDRTFTERTIVIFVVALVLFAVLLVIQVRTIVRSPHPRLAAITALALSVPLFAVSYSAVYYLLERTSSTAFSQSMSRVDSLYFTVTVFTTVGFGDIAPRSESARVLVMSQMVLDLLLIGVVARVLLNAVQTGLASRDAKQAPEEE